MQNTLLHEIFTARLFREFHNLKKNAKFKWHKNLMLQN